MKKKLLILLFIFGLTIGYAQVRNVRINVPSNVTIVNDKDFSVQIDTIVSKYITMCYKDSTLYINSPYELTEPVKIRITTPDSLSITTGRFYKLIR